MQKALRVLAIIAVVASLVQVFDLVVEIIKPEYSPDGTSTYAQSAQMRWMIYWPSGLVIFLIAGVVRRKAALLGNSLLIGGVYLMLLGNNGGIWSVGHEIGRLVTSIVTLAILIWITIRLDKSSAANYEIPNNAEQATSRAIVFGDDE
jgi:hypothetical protein